MNITNALSTTLPFAAATTEATVASTVSTTNQVANQCFAFGNPCATMVFRYNQLSQQSNAAGITFGVTAFALCVLAVSQCAVACYDGWNLSSQRIRWAGVLGSLILATGYAVGAGMTINYDDESILNACVKQ